MIESVSILAPASKVDLYKKTYQPILENKTSLKINQMYIYNLLDKLERDNDVIGLYRKSLLYLVSNAFESTNNKRVKQTSLLCMEKFSKTIPDTYDKPMIHYSNGYCGYRSRASLYSGFDNDLVTMNNILKTILNKSPKMKFTKESLNY